MMRITVLYDDSSLPGFRHDWGFACLIEGKERVLFDTGASGSVLVHNLMQAGIRPETIDKIVLSHQHWDHVGGLPVLASANQHACVYALPAFAAGARLAAMGLPIEVVDAPMQISEDIYSTGPLGLHTEEQALCIAVGEYGVLLVTGCAHPGLEVMVEEVRTMGELCGLVGGLHDFENLDLLQGVDMLGACHCTQRRREIGLRYPGSVRDVRVGNVLAVT